HHHLLIDHLTTTEQIHLKLANVVQTMADPTPQIAARSAAIQPPLTDEKWTPNLGGERVVEDIHYGWLMKDHLARYHFAAPYCADKRVLDVATGTGYGANILRKQGAAEVVAVDREQAAL